MSKTLIYISSAAYESQVVNLLKEVVEYDYFDKITLLISETNDEVWNAQLDKLQNSNIHLKRFKKYPNYHLYNNVQSKEFHNTLKEVLSDNSIIHIRGEFFARPVRKAIKKLEFKNVKILSDVRGASYEETVIYKKRKPFLTKLKLYQQRKTINQLKYYSDYVSVVSQKLKEYVIDRSNFDRRKIFINHCIAGEEFDYDSDVRQEFRDKLELDKDDILFLFMTGGNSNWQNTDEIINNIADKGYKILNLSKIKFDHKNVISLFVHYSEVPKYLNASDISIVWRNDDVVNNVACPIKFGEYVCCGLPVVANNGVDLINKYIEETEYGIVISDFKEINDQNIKRLANLNRETISKNARLLFALKNVVKGYMSLYKEIIKD